MKRGGLDVSRDVVIACGVSGVIVSPASRVVDLSAYRSFLVDRLRLLRLVTRAGVGPAIGLTSIYVVMYVIPIAMAFASGALVARAILLGSQEGSIASLIPLLAAVGVLLILDQTVPTLVAPLELLVARRIDGALRADLRAVAMAPATVRHLEDPNFQDQIESVVGRRAERTLGTGVTGQWLVLTRICGALAAAGLFATFSVGLAAALFVSMWFLRSTLLRQFVDLARLGNSQVATVRRAHYWADMAGGTKSAKEVRVFGAATWLTDRFESLAFSAIAPRINFQMRIVREQWLVFLINFVTVAGTFLALGAADLRQEINHGELARYVQLAYAIYAFGFMGREGYAIEAAVLSFRAMERLRAIAAIGSGPRGLPPVVRSGDVQLVQFDHVGFAYAPDARPVFSDLTLDIRCGESLALVGNNGAGKTTLIKLLTGLYVPDSGRILVNGHDLREVDPTWWRGQLAVIFQDYTSYPLSARENVTIGSRASADQVELDAVARAADVLSVVDKLPKGWDTVLSRQYEGGADLSGGEWQRIVLARALFAMWAGRSILVLDEPTANLDVRAEAEMFRTLLDQPARATTILVSHRLSSVRNADRIVLLKDGSVAEDGSHDELMVAGKDYAEMFELQASRFRESSAVAPE